MWVIHTSSNTPLRKFCQEFYGIGGLPNTHPQGNRLSADFPGSSRMPVMTFWNHPLLACGQESPRTKLPTGESPDPGCLPESPPSSPLPHAHAAQVRKPKGPPLRDSQGVGGWDPRRGGGGGGGLPEVARRPRSPPRSFHFLSRGVAGRAVADSPPGAALFRSPPPAGRWRSPVTSQEAGSASLPGAGGAIGAGSACEPR